MAVCEPLSGAAALVVGLAGSAHCFAMCGGLSSALMLRAARGPGGVALPGAPPWGRMLGMHVGRLMCYTLMGALLGGAGQVLGIVVGLEQVALGLRMASGLVLLAVAATLLSSWRPLGRIERLGGRFWQAIAPLARHLPRDRVLGVLGLGAMWGLLPCGFLYSMLLFAALSGSAARGALSLASFGLGTVPALLGAHLLVVQAPRFARPVAFSRGSGWVLLACGLWTLLGPWVPVHH